MYKWTILLLFFGLFSCEEAEINEEAEKLFEDQNLVGNDRDEHGCIGSAGYTYSQAKEDCIQIWDAGIRMVSPDASKKDLNKADQTNDAQYINVAVFSNNMKKVEIFLGNEQNEKSPLLEMVGAKQYKNQEYEMKFINDYWVLNKNGAVFLVSENEVQ